MRLGRARLAGLDGRRARRSGALRLVDALPRLASSPAHRRATRRADRSPRHRRRAVQPGRTAAIAASSLLPVAGASAGSAAKTLGQHREPLLGALDQLGLELDEAVDDARPGDHVDLVEAQLDPRVAVAHDPLAAQLADRDELDERRVAGQLEHQRPRVRGRPFERARRPIRRSLELLAAHGAAGALGPGQRLDRDDRALARLAEPDREAGLGQRPVRGVHVAILELR